jgi:hypothetical protein
MAQVKLGRLEAEEGELPPLCLRCGRPAVVVKSWSFRCYPEWAYLLLLLTFWPFLLLSPILRQRLRVRAPLCLVHQHYPWRRRLISWAVFVAVVIVMIISLVLAADPGLSSGSYGILWLLFWFGGLLWLAVTFLVRVNTLCASEITDDSITLNGVSGVFVERLRAEKEGAPGQIRRDEDKQESHRPAGGVERSFEREAPWRGRRR